MKKRILLTAIMAFVGILTFSTVAEAQNGCGERGSHKHVFNQFGNRTVVWHNNYNQCGNGWGYNSWIGDQMCFHMRNIWNGGRCGRAAVRCNHRGCGMFGSSFRNGRFYNIPRGNGIYRGGHGRGGRYNQGGNRGNRYNQGGNRGNRYNQGGNRGNRYNQGGNRGNRNGNGNGGNRNGGRSGR